MSLLETDLFKTRPAEISRWSASSGWMLSWPWWSCTTGNQAKGLFNWYSPLSKALDALTISLLKKSYRYALLNLGQQLAPMIKHNGYYSLSRRQSNIPAFDDRPIPKLVIPKYAQNVENLVRFYTDPVHRAEHHAVREPHLPGLPGLSFQQSASSSTEQTKRSSISTETP